MKDAERFQIVTGFIFSMLYKKLPWMIVVDFDEICQNFCTRDDDDLAPWLKIFSITVDWLTEERFIISNCKDSKDLRFNIQITAKGLGQLLALATTALATTALATTADHKLIGDLLVDAADSLDCEKLRVYGRVVLMASTSVG